MQVLKLSVFGESHNEYVGATVEGIEPNIEIDLEYIKRELQKRSPSKNIYSTSRKEDDEFNVISGIFNNKTTGDPITVLFKNKDYSSKEYNKNILRPNHADYTKYIKSIGANDYRGGGHSSARLTVGLVFIGAICKYILEKEKIYILSAIKSIGDVEDNTNIEDIVKSGDDVIKLIDRYYKDEMFFLDYSKKDEAKKLIENIKNEKDSIGGKVRCYGFNIPAGLGEPFFNSFESELSSLAFSIPGVKAVEFGRGVEFAYMKGSESHDLYRYEDDKFKILSNNNGGILGGITNSNIIDFTLTIKPTPTILKEIETVDILNKKNVKHKFKSRSDICVVPRALPIVNSILSITMLDLYYKGKS